MGNSGLTPAFVIDEDALAEAIRDAYADLPDRDIDEAATPKQLIAIADAYARRLREKFGET